MAVKDIVLRRKGKVIVDANGDKNVNNDIYVATIGANIHSLGYFFSEELYAMLVKQSKEYLEEFGIWLVDELKKLKGGDVEYVPMYPGFPKQVMKMSHFELFKNAMIHYWKRDIHNLGVDFDETDEEALKNLKKEAKKRAKEVLKQEKKLLKGEEPKDIDKLLFLELGSQKDGEELLSNLLASSVAYSQADKDDLKELIKEYKWKNLLPEKMTNRENIATVLATILDETRYYPEKIETLEDDFEKSTRKLLLAKALKDALEVTKYVKSATDVLRLYVAMSGGDVSLAKASKFKSLPRAKRKFLLSLIESTEDIDIHISMRAERFKRMFEYLHIGEYTNKNGENVYPKTYSAIKLVRDGGKAKTFLARVQEKINAGEIKSALKILSEEPGMFARKLDEMLRRSENKAEVILEFEKVVKFVDVKILFTLREHFKARCMGKNFRVFFPKGSTAKAYTTVNNLPAIENDVADAVIAVCDIAIVEKLKTKDKLGKVYIDPALAKYKAPLVLRNVSGASKVITRGSRMPIDKGANYLRSFIWWKDDVDNDLSAVLLNPNWTYAGHISFTLLKDSYGCHSGDITYQRNNGVEGECEFIDIDLKKLEEMGVGYVAFEVHNYRGLTFDKSNCRFGYMELNKTFNFIQRPATREGIDKQIFPHTLDTFDPLTVKNLMNLTANATTMIPFLYDVKKREVVWCDMAITNNFALKMVETTLPSAIASCYACVNNEAPNLYDVICFNAISRGKVVEDEKDADIVFSVENGTPFKSDELVAKFLTI